MLEKSLWCFEPNRSQKKNYDIFPSPYKFFVGQAEVPFRPTSSENEEKLDFRKKPIQTELIKHFYTGHEVRFLA